MQRKSCQKVNSFKFSQIFGYKGPGEKVQNEDVITCLKFDQEGKLIALGDKAGRVIIFEHSKVNQRSGSAYEYFTEFQSHESAFDPLRSTEIDESVVSINWLKRQGKYAKIVTANTHSIKLWKIYQKMEKRVVKSAGKELAMPRLQNQSSAFVADLQRPFPAKHSAHIKQTSLSNNQQFLLSADEAQMFLWDLQRPERPYIVCDLSSGKGDEEEGINCCQLHPKHDSIFLYGMSKGSLRVGDLRVSSSVDTNSVCYRPSSCNRQQNVLIDMISSISSAVFAKNGKYLISRDFLTVKIWDVCNTKKPLNCITINEGIKSKLGEMVENDSIYDQFTVSASNDSATVLTGSYNNCFHIMDTESGANSQYELNYKKLTICRPIDKNTPPLTKMDYSKKVLASDFNPAQSVVALASLNCFYTYSL